MNLRNELLALKAWRSTRATSACVTHPDYAIFYQAAKLGELFPNCGAVAQLGERLVRNEEASGSIPLSSTNKLKRLQCALSHRLGVVVVW
jgi:hypothetical protein